MVSRLTWQKGMDVLLEAIPDLVALGAQLALVGSGESELEAALAVAATAHLGQAGAVIGFDESLAHLVQGGADALLVPSRFEPCGLTQLCALRYGAVPVVAQVGGLADTVIDADELAPAAGNGTGIRFAPVSRGNLELAIGRAIALWRNVESWRALQTRAMATDVGWARPARLYAALFRALAAQRAA